MAIGCSNGSVRVYDLGSGNGGKCTYVCDTKAAALGAYDDPDESMSTPPTIVSSLSFEGSHKTESVSGLAGSLQSSRNSLYLCVQHSSGWAAVMNRSSCFRGGEVVNGHWHESLWSHSPNVAPELPSGIALVTSDGVDSFSVVNEGGAGKASKRHCLVRRICRHPTQR